MMGHGSCGKDTGFSDRVTVGSNPTCPTEVPPRSDPEGDQEA
jgi:hypothetical protein